MKLNKYILPIALAVSALSFCSCNDFLDRHPQGQFTEDDNPGALAEGKVFNIYTMMRNYNITAGIPAFAIEYFRSEDSEKEVPPVTEPIRLRCTMISVQRQQRTDKSLLESELRRHLPV